MGLFKKLFGETEEADWQAGAGQPQRNDPAEELQGYANAEAVRQAFATGSPQIQTRVLEGEDARAAIQPMEKLLGMDLDGDGKIAGGADAPANPLAPLLGAPSAAVPGESRVDQLEKLVSLRDSGALTPEEFEREKARVLGDGVQT